MAQSGNSPSESGPFEKMIQVSLLRLVRGLKKRISQSTEKRHPQPEKRHPESRVSLYLKKVSLFRLNQMIQVTP